jgi:parallel beta-helix repeat protein
MNIRILYIFFLLLFYIQCAASNYYFSSTDGNDSRSALEAQNPLTPWRTIEKLNAITNTLSPGDTIFFKKGDLFFGTLNIKQSGTRNAPIVYAAYGKGYNPVISGFINVSSWTSRGNGIYESPRLSLSARPAMVAIDNQSQPMGRHPNVTEPNKGYSTILSARDNYFSDDDLTFSPNWTGGEVVIRKNRWIIDRARITNHSGNRVIYSGGSGYNTSSGFGYFIQDHVTTLDQFGEWYFNPDTRKLYVFFGNESPDQFTTQVAGLDILLDIDASHLHFEHLNFEGANEYNVLLDFSRNAYRRQENVQLSHCNITFAGKGAIQVDGHSNFRVDHCYIAHANNMGIYLGYQTQKVSITNNRVEHIATHPGMGENGDGNHMGLFSAAGELAVSNNVFRNIGYIPIYFLNGNAVLIKNNVVDTYCTVKDDGGGIYTYTGPSNVTLNNRKIEGNIVMNGIGAPQGTRNFFKAPAEGIYIDDNANNVEIIDNTIANCKGQGIYLHNARNINIENNTIFNNKIQLGFSNDNLGEPIRGIQIFNNIFFSKENHQTVIYYNSIADDVDQIGSLNSNFYARPLDDDLIIQTELNQYSDRNKRKWYDLDSWQSSFNRDNNSQGSPLDFEPFTIENQGNNRFSNGGFDFGTRGSYCYSPNGTCRVNWEIKNQLNGGVAKISGPGPIYFSQNVGSIKSHKKYLIKFSVIAEKEVTLEVFLRQNAGLWEKVSETKAAKAGLNRMDYEFVFSDISDEDNPSLIFYSGEDNISFWIDNIEFREVDAEMTAEEDFLRFEYNPTSKDTTIRLNGSYVDLEERPYFRRITLQPFESIILLKDTANITVLPVELTRFQSQLIDCNVQIEWTAQLESNFSHYILEKSQDGKRFQALSKIPGIQSTGQHTYSFTDKAPKSTNYYRLKMVDLDSTFSYSDVIVQSADCSGLNTTNWEVYPTLLKGQNRALNSRIYTQRDSITITVVDLNGRAVKSFQSSMQKGWNEIRWNMEDLSPGLYFIHNPDALFNKTIRFVVMD